MYFPLNLHLWTNTNIGTSHLHLFYFKALGDYFMLVVYILYGSDNETTQFNRIIHCKIRCD